MVFDFPYGDGADWQKALVLPSFVQPWLTDTGSLTARLKSLYPDFNLDLIGEGWQSHSAEQNPAYIREVLLNGGKKARVYAHTHIPQASLQANPDLQLLGERPLGEYLFQQDKIARGEIEFAQITRGHRIFTLAEQLAWATMPEIIYARRSQFLLNQKPFTVCEVFLADCPFYHV